jgi:hypothetical protein
LNVQGRPDNRLPRGSEEETKGLTDVLAYARQTAIKAGLSDPRLTSDAKHIEIGLMDKSDSMEWVIRELAVPLGINLTEMLVVGDKLGKVAESPTRNSLLMTPSPEGTVSMGTEPYDLPPRVIHLTGGPTRFLANRTSQRRGPFPPEPDSDPEPMP